MCEAGADPNIANQFNNTCLMIAAYNGHLKVVKTLLKRGVDPNVTGKTVKILPLFPIYQVFPREDKLQELRSLT